MYAVFLLNYVHGTSFEEQMAKSEHQRTN